MSERERERWLEEYGELGRRCQVVEERLEAIEDRLGMRLSSLDEKGTSYSRVLNQRVEGLYERVKGSSDRVGVLTVGVVLQLISFVGALLLFILGHLRVT